MAQEMRMIITDGPPLTKGRVPATGSTIVTPKNDTHELNAELCANLDDGTITVAPTASVAVRTFFFRFYVRRWMQQHAARNGQHVPEIAVPLSGVSAMLAVGIDSVKRPTNKHMTIGGVQSKQQFNHALAALQSALTLPGLRAFHGVHDASHNLAVYYNDDAVRDTHRAQLDNNVRLLRDALCAGLGIPTITQQQIDTLQNGRNADQVTIRAREDTIEDLRATSTRLQADHTRDQTTIQSHENTIQKLRDANAHLQADRARDQTTIQSHQNTIECLKAANTKLQEDLDFNKGAVRDQALTIGKCTTSIRSVEGSAAQAEVDLAVAMANLAQAKADLAEAKSTIRDQHTTIRDLGNTITSMSNQDDQKAPKKRPRATKRGNCEGSDGGSDWEESRDGSEGGGEMARPQGPPRRSGRNIT